MPLFSLGQNLKSKKILAQVQEGSLRDKRLGDKMAQKCPTSFFNFYS